MTGFETFWAAFSGWWIFIVAMIVCCILCFRKARARGFSCMPGRMPFRGDGEEGPTFSSYSAREILDKRYALGEIDIEEYEEMKRNLEAAD